MITDCLFIIPARGGSKGIPFKNIKVLGSKPLINYAIDLARRFVDDDCICVSTDSEEIMRVAEANKLKVPFKRPAELASDTAGSYEVMLHALDWYLQQGRSFKKLVLLQPTSPFRLNQHVSEALALYSDDIEMVVSVKEIKSNVFATYYKDTENGFIAKAFSSSGQGERRQDGSVFYELNGAVYVFSVNALRQRRPTEFTQVKKIVMDEVYSADIDEPLDWAWCEFLLEKKLIKLD